MTTRRVEVPAGGVRLAADVTMPGHPTGVVVFAHGSGSGRESPRNRAVAGALVDAGFATLLLDLLTGEESVEDRETGRWRFDVALLGERVVAAVDWLGGETELGAAPVGCFGASTGAAAALIAAAERPERVASVVSRGGRPDLAGDVLPRVSSPTLLIVGGNDPQVIDLNREAAAQLPARLEIVPGAGHLFEEPGALGRVTELTVGWFATHLSKGRRIMSRFPDRTAAGRELAAHLESYAGRRDAVVLGLARGGLPVAVEVARALDLPLDVFLVRKLGVPGHEELAMGAIASGGVRVLNEQVLDQVGARREEIEAVGARESDELERRERSYRDGRTPVEVAGRTVILVDDGLATGASMRAAVEALRQRGAAEIVVAVPIAPRSTCADLETYADAVICPRTPEPFRAVGVWYDDFAEVTDDDVRRTLSALNE